MADDVLSIWFDIYTETPGTAESFAKSWGKQQADKYIPNTLSQRLARARAMQRARKDGFLLDGVYGNPLLDASITRPGDLKELGLT